MVSVDARDFKSWLKFLCAQLCFIAISREFVGSIGGKIAFFLDLQGKYVKLHTKNSGHITRCCSYFCTNFGS